MSVNKRTMVIATGITFAILAHSPQSLGQGSTIGQVKTQYPAAISQTTEDFTKPNGIDLDVTYIRRTPLYNRYHVVWQDEKPILAPGTEDDKRWPDYGETVTFTAHFKNKGTQSSGTFQYRWYIDGAEVASGIWPNLAPGEEGTATYNWSWDHTVVNEQLQGQHTVALMVDPDDLVSETYETNNTVTDRTDALSLCYQIKPEVYQVLETPVDPVWPFSAEDWIQKQIAALNEAFIHSVHPLSSAGVEERVRLDQILVRSEPDNEICAEADGLWHQWEDSRGYPYWDAATDVDWGTPHEIGHRLLGLIDTYALGFVAQQGGSYLLDRNGSPVLLSRHYPEPGLMNNVDTIFAEEHSTALNLNKGYRRGYFGEYLYDVPDQTSVLVLDNKGNPAPGVNVFFFQQSGPTPHIDNIPEVNVTTDASGLAALPNRPINGSITTQTGHTYRDNPFGVINSFGGPGNIVLVRIQQGVHEEYTWLDITNINRLAWAGQDVLEIRSHVPPIGAPSPPGNFRLIRQQDTQVELRWDPSQTQGVTGYNVYRTVGVDHTWTIVASGITEQSFIAPTHGFHQTAGFAVTAVDGSGIESGFSDLVWILHMWRPSAIVVDDKGNRLIAASGNLLGLQDQNGQLLSWLGTYDEWVAYWTVGWHQPEERSHLTRDAGGKTIYSVPSQHEIVIGVPESQGPFQVFGSYGSEPGQLNTPTGVAVLGEPCSFGGPYTVDEHTLFLAHYDGDLDGEQGETATAMGTTFVQGKHNQGVLIDGSDSLAYPRVGNLESWQGTIEFWIKPTWDGGDTGFYELFQVKDDFYDYSNHAMWLGKDPGGNLGSWGRIYEDVSDLSAGQWYHIAVGWEGPEVTLYIDGTLRQSGYGDPRDFTAEFFNVGSACCSQGNQVNAVIDELRISSIHRLGNNNTCSRILVADSGNDRIQVFDRSGKVVSAFGSSGTGSGQFDNPQGMAVDDLDNLIVVDSGNNRLQILDFDGTNLTFVKEILGEFNTPQDVASPRHNQIVVADTGNNAIKVLDDEGHLLASYLEPNDGLYSGYFSQPHGLAVDLKGEIVVADTLNNRVVGISSPYVDPPVIQMNTGLNDAWFNPITGGQGFFITIFPEIEYVSLSWFTYDTERPDSGVTANLGEPGHRWLMALGQYYGNRAEMDISITSGGVFDTPNEVKEVINGTIILTFTDCASGTVEYDIPSIGRKGIVPIQRVVGDNIALCEAFEEQSVKQNSNTRQGTGKFNSLSSDIPVTTAELQPLVEVNVGLNDAWYYPITNGQGFFINVFPDIGYVSLSWFTYETERPPEGVTANLGEPGHRWLMALGTYSGNRAVMDISITSGGIFDTPTEVTEVNDGTIILTFTDCTSGTVEYDIPSIGRKGVVPIQRVVGDNVALCEALNTD